MNPMVIVAPYVTLLEPLEAPFAPPSLLEGGLPLLLCCDAFGCVELAGGAVEVLSSAMVVDRCWVLGGSCVVGVEIVLVIVKKSYFSQLVHSVLVSLSAVRETITKLNKKIN